MDDRDVEGGELRWSSHEKATSQSNEVGLWRRESPQSREDAVPDLIDNVGRVNFFFPSLKALMVCWHSDSKDRQIARAAIKLKDQLIYIKKF